MFWADKILQNRKGEELINDAWTPSGIIHMGGIKGPIIHDVINKVIREQGRKTKYTFGFDDMDAIDGLPKELESRLGDYMGIPIAHAPSPDGGGTFGEYYGRLMRDLFEKLGISAEIYLASDYYKKGVYDKAIKFVLDNADKIRKVYSEVYGKEISSDWFPLQVVCPNCGKVGTTKVTDWDGERVTYECSKTLVKWAKGCEKKGEISPFGGNAKMPFKVEWAAKWWTFGVTIEGAGKDHASAGGTYDIARKIMKDVFGKEPPLKLPYEFFLYDGKKMSSSKGLGLTAQSLLEVMPPELVRFLMIKTPPNQAVEFNPYGTQIIPRLYDDYQKCAQKHKDGIMDDDARAFELSQIGKDPLYPPEARFSTLAQWSQMPSVMNQIKGSELETWVNYAKVWVEKYAPEKDKFLVQESLPDISGLSFDQKKYLSELSNRLESSDSEKIQETVYNLSKEVNVSSLDAFKAIYISLLGKDHGPKAADLISSLDLEFVKKRFSEAAA